jgi:hypothetical protein
VGYWTSSRSRQKKKTKKEMTDQKKKRQINRQTCKAGTENDKKWTICEWQICCPRNRKSTDEQTGSQQICKCWDTLLKRFSVATMDAIKNKQVPMPVRHDEKHCDTNSMRGR